MEKSGLNNPEGRSEERTFEVNTEPPKVTLNQPTTPSKETKPSFSGNGERKHRSRGARVRRQQRGRRRSRVGQDDGVGGELDDDWRRAEQGAVGRQKHVLGVRDRDERSGNGPGKSGIVVFEVNTEPPEVTLNQPTTPSKETRPSFGGTASENTEVVVHVFAGGKGEGEEVASAKTTASGGSWSTTGAELSKALSEGKHTFSAYATEVSGLGNKAGKSAIVMFEVNTEPPVVTLNQPEDTVQ